jgi:hypothetical protein
VKKGEKKRKKGTEGRAGRAVGLFLPLKKDLICRFTLKKHI